MIGLHKLVDAKALLFWQYVPNSLKYAACRTKWIQYSSRLTQQDSANLMRIGFYLKLHQICSVPDPYYDRYGFRSGFRDYPKPLMQKSVAGCFFLRFQIAQQSTSTKSQTFRYQITFQQPYMNPREWVAQALPLPLSNRPLPHRLSSA